MDTLICAATWNELAAYGDLPPHHAFEGEFARTGDIGFLVTGVGIPCALVAVMDAAQRHRPQRILNIGIAGAYPDSGLDVGDIVIGDSEVYGDVGFELPEPPAFQPIHDAPFGAFYRDPLPLTLWPDPSGRATVGRGCTVNACTGTDATGKRRSASFVARFETMEGAAVAQVGQQLGIPVSEVRAISNIAARRDMRPENIRRAIESLAAFFQNSREDDHA